MDNQYPIIMLYLNKISLYRANFYIKVIIYSRFMYLLKNYYMDPPRYTALFIVKDGYSAVSS